MDVFVAKLLRDDEENETEELQRRSFWDVQVWAGPQQDDE